MNPIYHKVTVEIIFFCISSIWLTMVFHTCFDKNTVWAAPQCLCWWLRRHSDKNASWSIKQTHFAVTSPVLFCQEHFVMSTVLQVLPLNWMHSKIITVAAFRIIALTKIPKIEYLPLDWIYCSIRIILPRPWACIGVTHSFSPCPLLWALVAI